MMLLRLGACAAVSACTGIALANSSQQFCADASIPLQTTNWNSGVTIPAFDSSLGILTSVEFELTGEIAGSAAIESLDAQPTTVTIDYRAAISLTRPDQTVLVVALPMQNFVDQLSAFDGTFDFAGTSGMTHAGLAVTDVQTVLTNAPADLALFSGPPGNPGTIFLPADAAGSSLASGSGNVVSQFLTDAGAAVRVCYNYELDCNGNGIPDAQDLTNGSKDHDGDGVPDECQPGHRSFCAGDGLAFEGGIDCPCSNNGNPGEGCDNGTGSGALLSASGIPSLSNDSLSLTATQVPAGAPGVFFAASSSLSGGFGTHFHMGLRCIQPQVSIHKLTNGGTIPMRGSPSLSMYLGVSPGDTSYFQYWYRNSNGPCNGTANTTNAVEVTWGL